MNKIIECVPNFSEGRNQAVLDQIAEAIRAVDGVKLLNVDPGKATNRTVFTFVGEPDAVIDAAFEAIKMAASLIDMSKHSGEHPRMGATDVCPLIPVANMTLEEAAEYAHKLAKRVGEELPIPIYMYEAAATREDRRNLSIIRAGEYEALEKKLAQPEWKPDYGPAAFNAKAGATVIGARDFLVAYNINLNTKSTRIANAIAFDVREQGRVKRIGHPITGEVVLDENGEQVRIPGTLKAVKAIGWYIEEYGQAQISMNLTDINATSVHQAFDEVVQKAADRGVRVTGSEIVGMVPKKVLVDAGKHYLAKQGRSLGVTEMELMEIAVLSLGLEDISSFNVKERVIEYQLDNQGPLVQMNLSAFARETASESPAPGGGSIAAYVGALGAALGTMVANLSANKRGWENRVEEFSNWAVKGQDIMDRLLRLVDEDTAAFNEVMAAFQLPKETEEEKAARSKAIEAANWLAAYVPYKTMQTAEEIFDLCEAMVALGNPNSITDGAVGGICALAAIEGAYLNLKINLQGMKDSSEKADMLHNANDIMQSASTRKAAMLEKLTEVLA